MALDLGVFLEGAGSSFKVKVTENDAVAQYLKDKLFSSDNSVTITETNDGSTEKLDLTTAGSSDTNFANTNLNFDNNRTHNLLGYELILTGGQVTIKGAGATSGTTAFEVQNSSGSVSLRVTDDAIVNLFNSPRFNSSGSAGSVFYRPASSNGSTNFTQYINLNNSSGSETTYVSLNTRTVTHTAGSEDAEFTLNYMDNGSLATGLQINPSLTTLAGADFTYGDGSITGSSTTGQTLIQASGGLGSSRTRPLAVRRSSTSGSVGIEFKSSSATNGEIYTSFSGGSATGMVFELDSSVKMRIKTNTINFASLPTSSSGLASGDIWNDSGTLKIA